MIFGEPMVEFVAIDLEIDASESSPGQSQYACTSPSSESGMQCDGVSGTW